MLAMTNTDLVVNPQSRQCLAFQVRMTNVLGQQGIDDAAQRVNWE
jgi:hypothetical protein